MDLSLCGCGGVGGLVGMSPVCVPCRVKHNTEHIHTLNSISKAVVSELGGCKGL